MAPGGREDFKMYRYYLSAIYSDNKTKLGTWGNEVFEGKSLKRKLSNFKKNWHGKKQWADSVEKIIGVEIDVCSNGYHSLSIERIIF